MKRPKKVKPNVNPFEIFTLNPRAAHEGEVLKECGRRKPESTLLDQPKDYNPQPQAIPLPPIVPAADTQPTESNDAAERLEKRIEMEAARQRQEDESYMHAYSERKNQVLARLDAEFAIAFDFNAYWIDSQPERSFSDEIRNRNRLKLNLPSVQLQRVDSENTQPAPISNRPAPALSRALGRRYGKLVVIRRVADINNATAVLCRCDCGKEKAFRLQSLMRSGNPSCGTCAVGAETQLVNQLISTIVNHHLKKGR